jgi:cyclophilin family peptidyl-prolyl cis-trans isomerase
MCSDRRSGDECRAGQPVRRRLLLALPALVAAIGLSAACSSQASTPTAKSPNEQGAAQKPAEPKPAPKRWTSAPAMAIDQNKKYTAVIKTSLGDMTAELYPKDAPNTVNNFVFLSREGFYNGVIFHRIIKEFMVQTGDPLGTGTGDAGYKFNDELTGPHAYSKGTLAMANAGPNTQGSQFFICHGAGAERLPKNYTIFGKVTGGLDVLDKIAGVQVRNSPSGEPSQPIDPPRIESVQITEA